MRISINEQIYMLCESVLLGCLIALSYDLIRVLRRKLCTRTKLALFIDLLYSLSVVITICIFTLVAGEGELHLYMILFAAMGAALYFLSLSALCLPVLSIIIEILAFMLYVLYIPLQQFMKFMKHIADFVQKHFYFAKNHAILKQYINISRSVRKQANNRKGGILYGSQDYEKNEQKSLSAAYTKRAVGKTPPPADANGGRSASA